MCVPVDIDEATTFDPSGVPTLRMVAEDLDASTAPAGTKDISRTRLAAHEAVFDRFLKKVEHDARAERAKAKQMSLDF